MEPMSGIKYYTSVAEMRADYGRMVVDDPVILPVLATASEKFPVRPPARFRLKRFTDWTKGEVILEDASSKHYHWTIPVEEAEFLRDWLTYIAQPELFEEVNGRYVRKRPMLLWRTPAQAKQGWCEEVFRVALH